MAFEGDPYRTLGLARGATLDEVKRAYRRLAKANHPDAAGAGALARFLAIQAAYERLAGGSGGPGASAGGPRPVRDTASQGRPGSGWRHQAALRRPVAGTSSTRRRRSGDGRRRHGGAAGPPGRRVRRSSGPGGPGRPGPGSGPRGKATLGSTSYDGADAGPFEPDWGGASWYGTTSGTYWTINPKEYADPRKHGPEYQARARRASTGRPRRGAEDGEAPDATEPRCRTAGSRRDRPRSGRDGDGIRRPPRTMDGSPGRDRAASGPSHTTGSWWDSTSGPRGGIPRSGGLEADTRSSRRGSPSAEWPRSRSDPRRRRSRPCPDRSAVRRPPRPDPASVPRLAPDRARPGLAVR